MKHIKKFEQFSLPIEANEGVFFKDKETVKFKEDYAKLVDEGDKRNKIIEMAKIHHPKSENPKAMNFYIAQIQKWDIAKLDEMVDKFHDNDSLEENIEKTIGVKKDSQNAPWK